eukprot:SAG25_NODE_2516_length_1557_cov_1.194787_3_plen_25_part_01
MEQLVAMGFRVVCMARTFSHRATAT